jgi:hypothetical protein
MNTSDKPLPSNKAVLETLLDQVNRGIDWLEPVIASQRFAAQHLDQATKDRYSILPQLELRRSLKERMRKHTALGGPNRDLLVEYIDQDAVNKIWRTREPAASQLTSIARGQITADQWRPAAAAILQTADADAAFVGLLRELRGRIIDKLESQAVLANAEIGADNGADSNQKNAAVRSPRLPQNPKVLRLAIEIQKKSGSGISQHQVAIEFTNGDQRKADNLLRQLRRYPDLRKPGFFSPAVRADS